MKKFKTNFTVFIMQNQYLLIKRIFFGKKLNYIIDKSLRTLYLKTGSTQRVPATLTSHSLTSNGMFNQQDFIESNRPMFANIP